MVGLRCAQPKGIEGVSTYERDNNRPQVKVKQLRALVTDWRTGILLAVVVAQIAAIALLRPAEPPPPGDLVLPFVVIMSPIWPLQVLQAFQLFGFAFN